MKKVLNGLLVSVMFSVIAWNASAQDAEVTDEDIKNYAIIELAKNSIVSAISPMVNELIEKQEGMTGQRFQELQLVLGAFIFRLGQQIIDLVAGLTLLQAVQHTFL